MPLVTIVGDTTALLKQKNRWHCSSGVSLAVKKIYIKKKKKKIITVRVALLARVRMLVGCEAVGTTGRVWGCWHDRSGVRLLARQGGCEAVGTTDRVWGTTGRVWGCWHDRSGVRHDRSGVRLLARQVGCEARQVGCEAVGRVWGTTGRVWGCWHDRSGVRHDKSGVRLLVGCEAVGTTGRMWGTTGRVWEECGGQGLPTGRAVNSRCYQSLFMPRGSGGWPVE